MSELAELPGACACGGHLATLLEIFAELLAAKDAQDVCIISSTQGSSCTLQQYCITLVRSTGKTRRLQLTIIRCMSKSAAHVVAVPVMGLDPADTTKVLPGLESCNSPNPTTLKNGCLGTAPSIGMDQYGLW